MTDAKGKAMAFIAEIDEAELAVRIAEIAIQLKRPKNKSPAKIMEIMKGRAILSGDEHQIYTINSFHLMARAAIEYLQECIQKGKTPS